MYTKTESPAFQNVPKRAPRLTKPFSTCTRMTTGLTWAFPFSFFVVKHSPVWILPLVTANIIDALSRPSANTASVFWLNGVLLLGVLLIHLPTSHFYMLYHGAARP